MGLLDLFGTGISDDSFCRFCIKGYCPVSSQLDSLAAFFCDGNEP